MKTALFLFLLFSFSLMAQTYLNKNWVLFNTSNSSLISDLINEIFEENNNYWISSVKEDRYYLQLYSNGNWINFDSTNSPFKSSICVIDINKTKDGKMLFATANNGLYIKSGSSWDSINTRNSPLPSNELIMVTVDNFNRYWIGILNYGIAVYDNGNWRFFNDDNSFFGIHDFNFIEIDSLNKVWVGTDYYGFYYFDGIRWNRTMSSSFFSGPSIVSLSVDRHNVKWFSIIDRIPNQRSRLRVGKSINDTTYVFYDSTHWGSHSISFLSYYSGLLIDKKNVKYIATTDGLLVYNDTTWRFFNNSNSPIPANGFNEGIIDSKNNKVFIHDSYRPYRGFGLIFYNEDSVIVTSVDDQFQLVENFYLYQNYPNPFNPKTIISWDAPVASRNTLKVYDILGNEIATLVNEYKAAGRHQVEFDATGLPSGVYVYKLTAGSFISSKKMVVIK